MSKNQDHSEAHFPEKIKYEHIIGSLFGREWRNLPMRDRDGALGVAIICSILKGSKPTLYDVSKHIGVSMDDLYESFTRLSLNGAFSKTRINKDRDSIFGQHGRSHDYYLALGYWAGLASGYTGTVKFVK